MKKKIKIFLFAMLAWFLVHSIIIMYNGLNDNIAKADCILILGNKVNEDGTLSDRLKARVEKGFKLYNSGYSTKIIVSGGLGKEGYYEGTEMKKFLVQKGISAENIIVDNNGINTDETGTNFKKIADSTNFKSVIVVSQFYHIARAKTILKNKGVEMVYTAHAEYYEMRDVYSVVREFFSFYNYLICNNKE